MPDSHVASTSPFRRAADASAFRLGRAILGYLSVITLIITLAPFQFAPVPAHGVSFLVDWSDAVMNVVMFVPIGFVYQLTRPVGTAVPWWRVMVFGATLSGVIEAAQLFEASRYTSVIDWITNTTGALMGAWICTIALRRIEGRSAVRTLALELPLMGLVYLLIPLLWLIGLASEGGGRAWLMLPVLAFASGIIGTVYAAYVIPSRQMHRGWLIVAVLGWFLVALMPGAIRARDLLVTGALVSVGIAWLRSESTRRIIAASGSRRFEMPTLRLVLPLFAAYLTLSSLWPLWPLDGADGSWRTLIALLPADDASNRSVFIALEHVAAFTLVGYIIAEFHGRDLETYREIGWRVVVWSGGLSLLLEGARGFHPAYYASALMLFLTIGAAIFGGRLYQLQRDHVRALLARRTSPAVVST